MWIHSESKELNNKVFSLKIKSYSSHTMRALIFFQWFKKNIKKENISWTRLCNYIQESYSAHGECEWLTLSSYECWKNWNKRQFQVS